MTAETVPVLLPIVGPANSKVPSYLNVPGIKNVCATSIIELTN